ncbi:NUDIX hydrolase [Halobacillus sp. B23F22_1]|uniref:NUDIX hydrolase n=1 Tax=Halobacillus sp. B23F22_1 TaxID=3459514 RepID=UPI00373E734C
MEKVVCCFTILFNKEGRMLLINKENTVWDLPGGNCRIQETPEQCAIRKTKEETGYRMKVIESLIAYGITHAPYKHYLFVGQLREDETYINDKEINFEWFYPNHLPLSLLPHRRNQINLFLQFL